jgi:hypothetical protein
VTPDSKDCEIQLICDEDVFQLDDDLQLIHTPVSVSHGFEQDTFFV